MNVLVLLIPVTLAMGLIGLAAFIWSLRNGQYEDLAGAAERVLLDDDSLLPETNTPPTMNARSGAASEKVPR